MRPPARHRRPASLLPRVIFILAAALALAAGFIPGLLTASAAPVTAPAVLLAVTQDRGTELGAVSLAAELALDKNTVAQAVRMAALARARAVTAAMTYAVRPGDSLSGVAARHCGAARDWTGIYAASRARRWTPANANSLTAGQHLWLACAYLPSMLRFAPAPPPPPPPPVVRVVTAAVTTAGTSGYHRTYHRSYAASSYSAPAATYQGASGSYQACVISRESGGNSQVMNGSGHYGLYQFDYGTWVSGGGSGADFGHASVSEQNRVFASVYAARGTQPWSPSDGC